MKNGGQMNEEQGSGTGEGLVEQMVRSGEETDWRRLCREVGRMYSLDYEYATVSVYDYDKSLAGGLARGGFLVTAEEHMGQGSFLLLRILGGARLPTAAEREDLIWRATRETAGRESWTKAVSEEERTDASWDGIKCRILGTFKHKEKGWRFYPDINSYTAVAQHRVWKPEEGTLDVIVNRQREADGKETGARLRMGMLRYAASQEEKEASTEVMPPLADFVRRRSAFLGQSRFGKSNGLAYLAGQIYWARGADGKGPRVGQIIFDQAAEYSRDNPQMEDALYRAHERLGRGSKGEVSVFSMEAEGEERPIRVNFFGRNVLREAQAAQWDYEAVERALAPAAMCKHFMGMMMKRPGQAQYVAQFLNAELEIPEDIEESHGQRNRLAKLLFAWWGALVDAGYAPPRWRPRFKNLISSDARGVMERRGYVEEAAIAARWADGSEVEWREIPKVMAAVYKCTEGKGSDEKLPPRFAEGPMEQVLQIYKSRNGARQLTQLKQWHDPGTGKDYREEITQALNAGELVIVDLSIGTKEMARRASEEIMEYIYRSRVEKFRGRRTPTDVEDVIVYLEEAHQLLPSKGKEDRLESVWAKAVKEGSKVGIGVVISTQAPSTVMQEFLSETDNWIVGYLGSEPERNEVAKYQDLKDWKHQMGNVGEPGFVRVRTLSQSYTVPVQQPLFSVKASKEG